MLCKVSLKSTPCISTGSYRLINSWQNKLSRFQWITLSSSVAVEQRQREQRGGEPPLFTGGRLCKMLKSSGDQGIHSMVVNYGTTYTVVNSQAQKKAITEMNLGGSVSTETELMRFVATECPAHPTSSSCVPQSLWVVYSQMFSYYSWEYNLYRQHMALCNYCLSVLSEN